MVSNVSAIWKEVKKLLIGMVKEKARVKLEKMTLAFFMYFIKYLDK